MPLLLLTVESVGEDFSLGFIVFKAVRPTHLCIRQGAGSGGTRKGGVIDGDEAEAGPEAFVPFEVVEE